MHAIIPERRSNDAKEHEQEGRGCCHCDVNKRSSPFRTRLLLEYRTTWHALFLPLRVPFVRVEA